MTHNINPDEGDRDLQTVIVNLAMTQLITQEDVSTFIGHYCLKSYVEQTKKIIEIQDQKTGR
jgi:hypothetical protein